MDDLLRQIETRKAELDRLRPLTLPALSGLQKFYDVELTYSSNAIEGNSLTLRETAEVIEHGITVGGKTLRDHLEAVDHYDAVQWMRALAGQFTPIGESIVRELHRRIVARSQPEIAGIYSRLPRRVAGSPVIFPNPLKIPALMAAFGTWLESAAAEPPGAFEAHYRLTAIHPFGDGNGRTARLLMNLLLIRGGHPPLAIRPEDRKAYLDGLERASLAGDEQPYRKFMHERLDATLAEYLAALRDTLPPPKADAPSSGTGDGNQTP
jgi:Fic family protein